MKLRLNLLDQDLAYRFGVSQPTVSRIIKKWVDILYVCLKPLVMWPERGELGKTLPEDFKRHFQNVFVL
jgi:predicted transcriptional regulator